MHNLLTPQNSVTLTQHFYSAYMVPRGWVNHVASCEYLPDNKESITSQAKYCDVLESCLNLNDKMTLLLDFCNFNDNNLEVVMRLSTHLSLAESAIIAISSGSGSFINDKSIANRL